MAGTLRTTAFGKKHTKKGTKRTFLLFSGQTKNALWGEKVSKCDRVTEINVFFRRSVVAAETLMLKITLKRKQRLQIDYFF